MHIAMWSGPRNLSTALMYSFASRDDFDVIDEPFYAPFLQKTGAIHPMRDEIIACSELDCDKINAALNTPGNGLYSKQMAHHVVEGIPTDWCATARHAILIRHPARVLASYAAKRENPSSDDIGLAPLMRIREMLRAMGHEPVVVDSFDIRSRPETTLRSLCSALGIAWDPAMLSWPAGGRPEDGVWASHWYGAVHRSTGFAGSEGPLPELSGHLAELAEDAIPLYNELVAQKI